MASFLHGCVMNSLFEFVRFDAMKAITGASEKGSRVFENETFKDQLSETLWLDTPEQIEAILDRWVYQSLDRAVWTEGGKPRTLYEPVREELKKLPQHRQEALGSEENNWKGCTVMRKHWRESPVRQGDVEVDVPDKWRVSDATHARMRLDSRPSDNLCVRNPPPPRPYPPSPRGVATSGSSASASQCD